MIPFAILLLTVLGFGALCASRERHQRDLFGRQFRHSRNRLLRIAGWTGIVLALLLAIAALGAAVGLITWTGFLSLGALTSVAWLNRANARGKI